MKSFKQFLTEIRGGKAAEQAQRTGLISDGHGGWLNRQGNLVARTENDRLVFIKKRPPQKQQPTQEKDRPANLQLEPSPKLPKTQPLPLPKKQKQEEPPPEIESFRSITVVFGKFNPPTKGHHQLLKKAREASQGMELRIYPSRIQNEQNPLDPKNKVRYMRLAFPEFADEIVNSQDMTTIFDVLHDLQDDGYRKVQIVVGSQRESEFDRLANQYNGKLYDFEEIDVIPASIKDPDSDTTDPTSSGALRRAATKNDYYSFKAGLPAKMPEKEKRNLFYAVQRAYEKKYQVKEEWKVAPELYQKELKEKYYQNEIYNVGDEIQSQITGITGIVKRRGPNYVICVNEELDLMFKPWIQDITEWTNNCGTTEKEKEIGTPERLKYVMRMTPPITAISNYLEKRRKSK